MQRLSRSLNATTNVHKHCKKAKHKVVGASRCEALSGPLLVMTLAALRQTSKKIYRALDKAASSRGGHDKTRHADDGSAVSWSSSHKSERLPPGCQPSVTGKVLVKLLPIQLYSQ